MLFYVLLIFIARTLDRDSLKESDAHFHCPDSLISWSPGTIDAKVLFIFYAAEFPWVACLC